MGLQCLLVYKQKTLHCLPIAVRWKSDKIPSKQMGKGQRMQELSCAGRRVKGALAHPGGTHIVETHQSSEAAHRSQQWTSPLGTQSCAQGSENSSGGSQPSSTASPTDNRHPPCITALHPLGPAWDLGGNSSKQPPTRARGNYPPGWRPLIRLFFFSVQPQTAFQPASFRSFRMGTFSIHKTQPQALVFRQMLELFLVPKEMFHLFHFFCVFRNKLTAIFHLYLHAISLHLNLYFCN